MSFLLKIVEGPNKGAEIALVDGVAVTLGKADDCDIVLADPTLPDAPFTVEASPSGVTLDGSAMTPFHVKSFGSTAFAVGPSDDAWGELVWEEQEGEMGNGERGMGNGEPGTGNGEGGTENGESGDDASRQTPDSDAAPKRRGGCLGCLIAIVAFLLILAGLAWFFRDVLRPRIEQLLERAGVADGTGGMRSGETGGVSGAQEPATAQAALAALAEKYGLSFTNANGKTALAGNFGTRAERLVAAAEAYECQPGIELDLTDDESFRTAASDALFTLTEGALKVTAATNRVLAIAGGSPSADALAKTLKALNADMPKLRNVDVTGVRLGVPVAGISAGGDADAARRDGGSTSLPNRKPRTANREPRIPVCGILTTPYPCLVLQNGQRVLEGATVGDSVILKIAADSVVVTNASGRFTWKP